MTYLSVVGDLIPDFIVKVIRLFGKPIYTNRWHVLFGLLFTSPIGSHKFFWISCRNAGPKIALDAPVVKRAKEKGEV